jgi:hypothetical protein
MDELTSLPMIEAESDRPDGARAAAKPGINSQAILVSAMALLLFGHTQIGKSEAKPLPHGNGPPKARHSNARQDLRTALMKSRIAYPYRLTHISSTDENGQSSSETSVTEFASANRLRVTTSETGGKRSEMIIIGGTNYIFLDGQWTKEPLSAKEQADMRRDQDRLSSSLSDVKFIGVETINGIKHKIYTFRWGVDISVSGKSPSGTGKAWIGVRDGLPHQMDLDLDIQGHHTKSHMVYEYHVKLDIHRPIR